MSFPEKRYNFNFFMDFVFHLLLKIVLVFFNNMSFSLLPTESTAVQGNLKFEN